MSRVGFTLNYEWVPIFGTGRTQWAGLHAYFAVWWLMTEVDNGGFHQFFFNSTGGYRPETMAGLRMIGADVTAGIFQQAVAVLPNPTLPRDDTERRAMLSNISPASRLRLEELTEAFYEYPDDLWGKLNSFVETHRDQFVVAPP